MKTTIDVDRAAADEAARLLGTATLKDTVNAALREIVAAAGRRELAQLVRSGELTVPTPHELARLDDPGIEVGALDGVEKLLPGA